MWLFSHCPFRSFQVFDLSSLVEKGLGWYRVGNREPSAQAVEVTCTAFCSLHPGFPALTPTMIPHWQTDFGKKKWHNWKWCCCLTLQTSISSIYGFVSLTQDWGNGKIRSVWGNHLEVSKGFVAGLSWLTLKPNTPVFLLQIVMRNVASVVLAFPPTPGRES